MLISLESAPAGGGALMDPSSTRQAATMVRGSKAACTPTPYNLYEFDMLFENVVRSWGIDFVIYFQLFSFAFLQAVLMVQGICRDLLVPSQRI